jgi:hypothetical protein
MSKPNKAQKLYVKYNRVEFLVVFVKYTVQMIVTHLQQQIIIAHLLINMEINILGPVITCSIEIIALNMVYKLYQWTRQNDNINRNSQCEIELNRNISK